MPGACTVSASKPCLGALAHTEGTRAPGAGQQHCWEPWGDLHGAGEHWGTAFTLGSQHRKDMQLLG